MSKNVLAPNPISGKKKNQSKAPSYAAPVEEPMEAAPVEEAPAEPGPLLGGPNGTGGAYPLAQEYRQYLQQPPSGPGARMSYTQFVESKGGQSPGMANTSGSKTKNYGAPEGGIEQWQDYRNLGMGGNALAYRDKWGDSYDPRGTVAAAYAKSLRKKKSGGGFFGGLLTGGLGGGLGDAARKLNTGLVKLGNATSGGLGDATVGKWTGTSTGGK